MRKMAFALVALAVLVPIVSRAQDHLLFRVNIPFAFVANGAHLEAGSYLAFHTTPLIIAFVREDGKGSAWIPVMPSPRTIEGLNQIIFHKYGNTYFLAKVHTEHDLQMHDCFRCPEEQKLSAGLHGHQPVTVALAGTM